MQEMQLERDWRLKWWAGNSVARQHQMVISRMTADEEKEESEG